MCPATSPSHPSRTALHQSFPMPSSRVILRLREAQFPNISYPEIIACVKAFLSFKERPAEEADQGKHFWHFQLPTGDKPGTDSRFHIVIDVEKSGHSGKLSKDFPHEIYRVVRSEDKM